MLFCILDYSSKAKPIKDFSVSMPVDLDNSSTASGEASVSSSGNQSQPPKPTAKKKRSLPGMPGKINKENMSFSTVFLVFDLFLGLWQIQMRK